MAEGKEHEKSFEKKRRNLMVLSTIVLIYEFGGGTIEKLPIPGGSIALAKPEVAIYFTWLAFVYFLWRFWQVSQPKHLEIKQAFNDSLKEENLFGRLLLPYHEKLHKMVGVTYPVLHREIHEAKFGLDFKRLPREKAIARIVKIQPAKIPFLRVLNWGGADEQIKNIAVHKGWAINQYSEICANAPFSLIIVQSKVAFVTLIKHISFSDVYLPYLYWAFTAGIVFRNHFR